MGVTIPVGFGQWTLPFALSTDFEPMVITCGFDDDPAQTPNTIADTITNQLLARPTFAAGSFPTQYTIGPGEVTVNRTLGTFTGIGSVTRTGTGGQLTLPQNCAILIRKTTTRGGRRGRGRMFLPPMAIAEGNVTANGGLLATVRDAITLDFETWRANLVPLNHTLRLLHSDPLVGPPVPPDLITALTCDSVIATQRTRLRP